MDSFALAIGPWLLIGTALVLFFAIGVVVGIRMTGPYREVRIVDLTVPIVESQPSLVEATVADANARIGKLAHELFVTEQALLRASDRVLELRDELDTKERLRAKWHRLYRRYSKKYSDLQVAASSFGNQEGNKP